VCARRARSTPRRFRWKTRQILSGARAAQANRRSSRCIRLRTMPAVLKAFRRVQYNQKTDLGAGRASRFSTRVTFSAPLTCCWNGRRRTSRASLLFTADVGRYNTPILRDPQPVPARRRSCHHREHLRHIRARARSRRSSRSLLDAVQFCIDAQSRLLVPSFAVGARRRSCGTCRSSSRKKIPPIPSSSTARWASKSADPQRFRDNYDEQTKRMIGNKDLFGLRA
jgi:Cft2 family RNA processing exonuclease